MKFRSVAAGASVAAALILNLMAGSAALAANAPTTCIDGHWPATVEGRPTLFSAGAAAGDYVWHDSTGWHVRVTHRGDDKRVLSGRVVASAPLDADPVKLEPADQLTLSADRRTITFRFTNYGAIDGFDFTTACAQHLTFKFEIVGARTPVSRIWLGHGNRHPLENPFVITRIG